MAKPKRDEFIRNVSFRLFGNEARRWDEVLRRARVVDPAANKTDAVRGLLGLPPDKPEKPEVITDGDRNYFLGMGGTKLEVIGRSSHLNEAAETPITVEGKQKRKVTPARGAEIIPKPAKPSLTGSTKSQESDGKGKTGTDN